MATGKDVLELDEAPGSGVLDGGIQVPVKLPNTPRGKLYRAPLSRLPGAGGTTPTPGVSGGAPQWVAGKQTAGALVFDDGIVYRVKINITNGKARPAAYPAGYLAIGSPLTPDQVAALQADGASATNLFVLNDDYRLDPSLLHLLPVGDHCYMYGPDDGSNQYGSDGTGKGHEGNIYGFGTTDAAFGDDHIYNSYGDGLEGCTFGNTHFNNKYGPNLRISTFGSSHFNNTYGSNVLNSLFRDNHRGNTYGNGLTNGTFGNNNRYNSIGDDCSFIETKTGVTECVVGDNCAGIIFGANCKNVKVFDTRQGSGVTDPTGATTLMIPAGTQNAVYRRGVLETTGGSGAGTTRDLLDMTPAFLDSVMALAFDVNGDAPLNSAPTGSYPGQWFNAIDADGNSFRYECGRHRYVAGDTTAAGIGPAWSRQLRLQP